MEINTAVREVPDTTYFRVSDVEPRVEEGRIWLTAGRGTRRSWGAPQVNNTILVETCEFVAVHTGFSHKHGGGQFYRYFVAGPDGRPRRVRWAKLSDDEQQMVLDAYEQKAPAWARRPGKLRRNYKRPTPRRITTYKIVRQDPDGSMWSLYDGLTEYQIGRRLAQAVGRRAGDVDRHGDTIHSGGYYSHPDLDRLLDLWWAGRLVPARCLENVSSMAVIKCEASGRIVEFSSGKLASTYLRPVEVLDTITLKA